MRHWYVVQTKPRQELVAIENLERQGYLSYCPKIKLAKRRRQRWQQVVEPLFPRYLFVQLDIGEDDFAPIRSTVGVIGLVRFGSQTASISQQAISAIQMQEQCIFAEDANHPTWKPGDVVKIIDGPFAGLSGVFEKDNSEERVIILLEMLGRKNRITVAANSVLSV